VLPTLNFSRLLVCRALAGFEGTYLDSSQLPFHAANATKPFVLNEKQESFHSERRLPV